MAHKIEKSDLNDYCLNDVVCGSTEDNKRLEATFYPLKNKVIYELFKDTRIRGAKPQEFANIDDAIKAYNSL